MTGLLLGGNATSKQKHKMATPTDEEICHYIVSSAYGCSIQSSSRGKCSTTDKCTSDSKSQYNVTAKSDARKSGKTDSEGVVETSSNCSYDTLSHLALYPVVPLHSSRCHNKPISCLCLLPNQQLVTLATSPIVKVLCLSQLQQVS